MKIPCTCPCHSGVAMIHFVACCDNGYIDVATPPTTEEAELWNEAFEWIAQGFTLYDEVFFHKEDNDGDCPLSSVELAKLFAQFKKQKQ